MQTPVLAFVLALAAGHAAAAELTVKPGQKIQEAIAKANPGDVIRILAGVYVEALYVDKANITLTGVIQNGVWPKLDGEGRLNDGVVASASGFRVENLHIANYKGNGVMTQGADDVVIRRLIIDNTGIYGIYPTMGRNVVVEDNVAFGISDAAIYVGMCNGIDVRRNEVYANVAGIEIENSEHALVEHNMVYDNTGGILVFALPGLPKKKNEDVIIRHNFVISNNHRNFGAAGSVVAAVPPGTGILVLATDRVIIEDNVVRGNSLGGIIVTDLGVMPGMSKDPEVEPNPDDVAVLRNVLFQNGTQSLKTIFNWYHYVGRQVLSGGTPDGTAEDLLPRGADIIGTTKGERNCLEGGEAYTKIDAERFEPCEKGRTSAAVTTMIVAKDQMVARVVTDPGEDVYATVCSGCHAMEIRRVGPPVQEIRQKYAGNPAGIVAFATSPHKVREGFPEMPPQAHLGPDKLEAVARYLLKAEATHH